MLRRIIFLTLLLALAVAGPGMGQELTRSQLERQQDLLLRYGTRLREVDARHRTVARIRDIATKDQLYALDNLRISPSQARKLVKVLRENYPSTPLDDEGMKELRSKITPEFEDILGSEQFDLMLELLPSPQQKAKVKGILKHAGQTEEGKLALEAASELSKSLTPDQRSWMEPFLTLLEPDATPRPPESPPAEASEPAGGDNSRQLFLLRRTSLGDIFAEQNPKFHYKNHLPRRYRVSGGDTNVLAAVSTSSGLPVRILGHTTGDVFHVGATKLLGPPAVLAIDGGNEVWHGRVQGRFISDSPPTMELDTGYGNVVTASVELTTREQRAKFQEASRQFSTAMVEGTVVTADGKTTLYDATFSQYNPPEVRFPSGLIIQLSDEFLRSASESYLESIRQEFEKSGSGLFMRLGDSGLTLNGCGENQVRLFARGLIGHSGLTALETEIQLLFEVSAAGGKLNLKPVPGSIEMRVTFPVWAEVPAAWTDRLEKIVGDEYAKGTAFELPQDLKDKLLGTKLLTEEQFAGMRLFTYPSGDRRSSLLSLATPQQGGDDQVLAPRLGSPGEFGVAVSEQAINKALAEKLPELLPILRPLPEDLQEQGGVKLKRMEVKELDLKFRNGVIEISNCRVDVHWKYALFSGVEPGIRFSGEATVSGDGDPLNLKVKMAVHELEFLSSRITGQPPEEQAANRRKMLDAMENRDLSEPGPEPFRVEALGPRAVLKLQRIESSKKPSELRLRGRLDMVDPVEESKL